jgi:Domain of unknown function (DUF4198)
MPYRSLFLPFSLCLGLLGAAAAHAHEFWIEPVTQALSAGDSVRLALRVGEFFDGERVGISASQAVALRHVSQDGSQRDLRALLPAAPVGELAVPLTTLGTHLIAYDSQPSEIELSADTFHAYLHDEGLDFIKAQRQAAGQAAEPGRERFRRHIKTLLAVGTDRSQAGKPGQASRTATARSPDKAWATRVGQRLEIMPLADPLRMKPGGSLAVQILFDDQPLAGALVRAWHRQSGQTMIIRARTSPDGKAEFTLPKAGGWMISVVQMVPATGPGANGQRIDWDSHWGNLTFAVPLK